ncbi:copper transporter 1-like isoform X2 [Vigna umbellata]|uniref:copper transporter 1-like isoform X2 n=1 Tax=Vigna umbellata TaxID=87088 RepID=UPI001F5E96F7|nr:copper transporter 1-like isoform X2 [Vigna umbellata]
MDEHMHGMGGMASPPSPSPPTANDTMGTMMHHKMMMHMTFFWGKDTDILFQNWPGGKSDMYILALVFVFVMSVFVQLLSHTRFIKPGSNHVAAGQTLGFLITTFAFNKSPHDEGFDLPPVSC